MCRLPIVKYTWRPIPKEDIIQEEMKENPLKDLIRIQAAARACSYLQLMSVNPKVSKQELNELLSRRKQIEEIVFNRLLIRYMNKENNNG